VGRRRWGQELGSKTLGVVGLGSIGGSSPIEPRGCMNVVSYDPVVSAELRRLGIELVSLDSCSRSDAITVHTPLTAKQALVNDQTIAKLKKGVLLINAARGGIYDEQRWCAGSSRADRWRGVDDRGAPGLTDLVKLPKVVIRISAPRRKRRSCASPSDAARLCLPDVRTVTNAVNVPACRRRPRRAWRRIWCWHAGSAFLTQVSLQPLRITVECSGRRGLSPPIVGAAALARVSSSSRSTR
jgi:hypothetical protein